jgi:RNA-splicing ligase RtcB
LIELCGKYALGKIYCDNVEASAQAQIINFLNSPIAENSNPVWMPDVHAGAGCVIGTTLNYNGKICPNLIGVDINCGMETSLIPNIKKSDINFKELDDFIRKNIPLGTGKLRNFVHNKALKLKPEVEKICKKLNLDTDKILKAIATLGSGNHFTELNEDSDGNIYLVIHSGSRFFGLSIAKYHQKIAVENCDGIGIDKDLSYLENDAANEYLYDMKIAGEFANLSRKIMSEIIVEHFFNKSIFDSFTTIHNYMGTDNIIRKGAISAYENEKVLIPINMRDGSIIGIGKGNKDFNFSGPHGAGRLFSRSKAKENLSLDEFKSEMNGIWTSCISTKTLDESPMAYKPIADILFNIQDSVEVIEIIKPIYNIKGE